MASNAGGSGCEFELIDDGRLRVCFCGKKECCFLGGGGYGSVFKATLEQGYGIQVAIKRPENGGQVDDEIETLKSINHPNILKYYSEFKINNNR